ncbi:unnamed protein product [Brassica oleracea]
MDMNGKEIKSQIWDTEVLLELFWFTTSADRKLWRKRGLFNRLLSPLDVREVRMRYETEKPLKANASWNRGAFKCVVPKKQTK